MLKKGSTSRLLNVPASSPAAPPKKGEEKLETYWRERLILRRYRFTVSGGSNEDLAVRMDHEGVGCFFPLGTSDPAIAAAQARKIYEVVVKAGWAAAFEQFSRELIISFEWCMNPVLWTYTTIHTLVGAASKPEAVVTRSTANRQKILVAELDAGIRRALCWSINEQAGFISVPCESVEAFAGALAHTKPRMALINRNLAGRVGLKSANAIAPLQPGMPALTYSIHADGDQMFTSTPGGAEGYMVKRVKPDRLLEPILKVANRSELTTEDLLLRVKYYFQELLQLHSSEDKSALEKLTVREREVLGLLSKGCVDKEIAQAMGISVWTVHGHIKSIFERLQVHTRTEAVIRYLEK